MEQNAHADGYRFGIELEYRLILKHDPNSYWDRQKIKEKVANLWNNAGKGVEGHISMKYSYTMGKAEDFEVWSIVDEHSMDGTEDFLTCKCSAFIQARRYQQPMGPSLLLLRSDISSWF
jgi:hypothetical protein